nr:integrase, catalytic region, zinc finger, CCHC-type, peptidase aspartic, catalytic [Tanacetum cinerariifolium]
MYDVILQDCVSNDVKCSYLQSLSDLDALAKLQCMYLHKVKECDCLAQKLSNQTESVTKEVHNELLKRFAKVEKHSISLETALQKCKEQVKNDIVCNEKALNVFRKEREQYFKIQDLKAQLPQLKRNQSRDKVLPNNSQMKSKKTQVEVHLRIPSVSNKMKFVTACKDSLNSRALNAKAVCATCNKCLVDSNHFACVTKMLNDVNARTKKPTVVPNSTRKPKSQANKSAATHHKKKVASKSTKQKPQSYYRKLYETTRPICQLFHRLLTLLQIVQLILFIVDSGCMKHITGNQKLLCNFVEKFLDTIRFGNDQFAPILGYGDLVQGNATINRVYYVKGLNYNLFSVGQFCDANLKATPTQAWLWHRRLSHLNFNYINLFSKKDIVALQNKQSEFERYTAFNDRTINYDKLKRKLNETLGLLAQKEIDIKEGLKVKAYEILVVKEKHDELVKQSLLTKSHYEVLVKEKTKVITDLKHKEEKDIDKMISMEKQLNFLNEIVYKRDQSIPTIHMLAPKGPTFNGRPTFANPMYLKKAQSEISCLYAIPNDQSDPANRLIPDREEALTLERDIRSKLNKDLV